MKVDPNKFVEFIPDPRGSCHDRVYAINSSRIRQELNWDPEYSRHLNICLNNIVGWKKNEYGNRT